MFPKKEKIKLFPFMAGVAIVIILAVGIIFFWNSQNTVSLTSSCTGLNREPYGIPSAAFESLPIPPKCFSGVVNAFQSGSFSDAYFFEPEYYLQPEFFPNFKNEGLKYWTDPSSTNYGAVGFGAFPFQKSIYVARNATKNERIFFHSGYGIRTLQGIRLQVEFENPADAQYANIRLDKIAEKGFLVGPSFPKFEKNWVRPIDIFVEAKGAFPNRSLKAKIVSVFPPDELSETAESFPYRYFRGTDYVGKRVVAEIEINIQ